MINKRKVKENYLIQLEGITVLVEKKVIKNMYLRISTEEGSVKVSAPIFMNDRQIQEFIQSRLPWIRAQKEKLEERVPATENNYFEGDMISLWGRKYRLLLEKSITEHKILLSEGTIKFCLPTNSTKEQRERLLHEYYRKQLKEKVPRLIQKWEPIMGVTVREWHIKKMKTRWGTCNVEARRIWISLKLAEKSEECLEYIVVHEMIHLLERGHGARFKSYMSQFLPEWRELEKRLKEQ